MIRAVSTRWNTTAELIGRAKDLRLALNLLVNMEQHNKSRGVRLKRFQLSTQEWDLLLQLYPLLDVSTIELSPCANASLPAGRRKNSVVQLRSEAKSRNRAWLQLWGPAASIHFPRAGKNVLSCACEAYEFCFTLRKVGIGPGRGYGCQRRQCTYLELERMYFLTLLLAGIP
jgi:hypothetical protein